MTPDTVVQADTIYTRMVSKEGLYGVAYFGHGNARQRKRCNTLWRRALALAARTV